MAALVPTSHDPSTPPCRVELYPHFVEYSEEVKPLARRLEELIDIYLLQPKDHRRLSPIAEDVVELGEVQFKITID
jgi:hypothetical protein